MARHVLARLFVALDPPESVCEQLVGWARTALRSAGERPGTGQPVRVLDAELLHVTLCFLGNQPLDSLEAICTQLASVAGKLGELSVGAPLWLPPRRPHALAVELHEDLGILSDLHRRLVASLAEMCGLGGQAHAPLRGAGRRHHRFRPHITVARMRTGAAPRQRTLTPTPPLSFTAHELVLYRSWLLPEGACYEAVASVVLAEQPSKM